MVFMRLLMILIICVAISSLCSCSIPLRIEVISKPDSMAESNIQLQQARFEYEQQEKLIYKIERKRLAGYNRIQKLRNMRLVKKKLLRLPKQEKELILQSFNDSGIILKVFEKLGCSVFDIAGFLNEYGKSDIDGFCDFLATKYPFTQWFRWALDKEIFIHAKRNYLLIRRINVAY